MQWKPNKGTLFAFLILGVFLISLIPLAVAENGSDKGQRGAPNGDKAAQIQARQQINDRIKAARDDIKYQRGQINATRTELKQRYDMAREQYQLDKKEFQDAKDKWNDAKKNLTGVDKGILRNETIQAAQNFLLAADRTMIGNFIALKTQVLASDQLTDSEKNTTISKIDVRITALEALQTDIQAATTKEQLKAVQEKVREQAKELQPLNREVISQMNHKKLGNIIGKGDLISERIQLIITQMKANGKNTTTLENLFADYKAKIATSLDELNKFNDNDAINADGSNKYIQASQKDIQDAHTILINILSEISDLRGVSGIRTSAVRSQGPPDHPGIPGHPRNFTAWNSTVTNSTAGNSTA